MAEIAKLCGRATYFAPEGMPRGQDICAQGRTVVKSFVVELAWTDKMSVKNTRKFAR